mmetsp:Transcript_30367/g.86949  ORF Transcript_30367/g.86949 Transcript_30367/m.86949 type:complete len:289 (+) Transcript_30367:1803-2669(+)
MPVARHFARSSAAEADLLPATGRGAAFSDDSSFNLGHWLEHHGARLPLLKYQRRNDAPRLHRDSTVTACPEPHMVGRCMDDVVPYWAPQVGPSQNRRPSKVLDHGCRRQISAISGLLLLETLASAVLWHAGIRSYLTPEQGTRGFLFCGSEHVHIAHLRNVLRRRNQRVEHLVDGLEVAHDLYATVLVVVLREYVRNARVRRNRGSCRSNEDDHQSDRGKQNSSAPCVKMIRQLAKSHSHSGRTISLAQPTRDPPARGPATAARGSLAGVLLDQIAERHKDEGQQYPN